MERLRLLIVEDSPPDAELVRDLLEQAGYEVEYQRVDMAEGFRSALTESRWDLVISDHSLPGLSAPTALQILRDSELDLPFVIVSGHIGDEALVAAMKAGAHDYILKDNLDRLIPAVERELREAENRRKQRAASASLRASEDRYRTAFDGVPIGLRLSDLDGYIIVANRAYQEMVGYTEDELHRLRIMDFTHPDDVQADVDLFRQAVAGERDGYQINKRYIRKDGQVTRARLKVAVMRDAEGTPMFDVGVVEDITEQERRFMSLGVHAALLLLGNRANPEQRALLAGAADSLRQTPASTQSMWERLSVPSVVALRERAHEEGLEAVYQEGRSLPFEDIVALMLALVEDYSRNLVSPGGARERLPIKSTLSGREREVLRLVGEGLSNKEIAGQLSISPSTVSYHLANIFNKLGVHSRAQAVAVSNEPAHFSGSPPRSSAPQESGDSGNR